jgi:hypothetical protein
MKKTTILVSLSAILLLAGIVSAQSSGRVYIATNAGVYIPAQQSGEIPTLDLSAGEPIKIRIQGPSGTGKTMSAGLLSKVTRTQIPCGAGGGAAGAPQDYFLVKTKNVYLVDTQVAWRGTCHVLRITLANNTEYRAKIRFQ